jgi:hypothetical protein
VSLRRSSRDIDEVDAVTPLAETTIERARRYVASESFDATDALALLDALGLLP